MAQSMYEGPSMLDGGPIIAVVTGFDRPSTNRKTGPMIQQTILRTDINPLEAARTSADNSICGDCKLKGGAGKGRTCYVTLARSPLQIFKTLAKATPLNKAWLTHRDFRFGNYGDPAAIPVNVTADTAEVVRMHTGYTHQWRTCDPELKNYLMASVDSEAEYHEAKAMGWATFRVKRVTDATQPGEVVCPASTHHRTCQACGLCKGGKTADVVIDVHGIGAKRWAREHA